MKNEILLTLAILLLAGCATEQPMIPAPLDLPKRVQDYSSLPSAGSTASATQVSATPVPPPQGRTQAGNPPPAAQPIANEQASINLSFEQVPLPTFIQTVYATLLKKNVNVDPAIVSREDLVTIRTGSPQTPTQVSDAVRLLLKSYGISVMDFGGIVRVVPDNTKLGYLPEIRRGRALPETPLPLRPVFQLVELQAVHQSNVANWIRTMFGNKVNVQEDINRNALWLNGQSEDVTAALEAIQVLDQPLMRGRHSARISPAFIAADELARKLTEILQAEGYGAGPATGLVLPITFVPIPAINAVIVFATDPAMIEHVTAWAKDLDQSAKGIGRSFFTYHVQYTDAQALATTLEKLISGAKVGAAPAASGRVVVDKTSNTIIFQGNNDDYGQMHSILQMLDKPSKEALIEVTVAEVSLNDQSQLGVEWLLKEARLDGTKIVAGTLGGLGIGTSGLNYRRIDSAGDTRLLLNALASNNRATILSSPRVLARNGESATIQVGQEVPIVTSQQTTPTTGGTGGVLQTVQYRSTGVILKVTPVIHSGNQIDLDVSQEVSAAQTTTTGVSTSPTFGTRKVETRLSIKDGATVLLGGLISSNGSQGNAGIPLLKDIPGLGQLFRTNSDNTDRSELIILITPYIIADDNDAQAVTDAFRKQLGGWAENIARPVQPPLAPAPSPPLPSDKAVDPKISTVPPIPINQSPNPEEQSPPQ